MLIGGRPLPERPLWVRLLTIVLVLRCDEHRKTTDWSPGRNGAWDYVCTCVPQSNISQQRLKVGVRVGHEAITDISQPYMLEAPYIK